MALRDGDVEMRWFLVDEGSDVAAQLLKRLGRPPH